MTREMFDADGAPAQYPGHGTTVAAGYLAGGDNNGWTAAEWARVRSWPEIERLLPIYVASPHESPEAAAAGAEEGLRAHGFPAGSTVVLDLEHPDYAALIAAGYPGRFQPAGYPVMVYVSRSQLDDLRRHWGGAVWAAQWTGAPHEIPGAAAVQWDGGPGKPIDLSTIYANVPLAPARDPQEHPMTNGVAILLTPSGAGYWCIDDDGGVFCFGDARFFGSMGGHHLNAPIVSAAATVRGDGYVLYARDKGVFPFGSVKYHGNPNDPKAPAHAGPHVDPAAVARAEADARAGIAAAAAPHVASGPPPDDAPLAPHVPEPAAEPAEPAEVEGDEPAADDEQAEAPEPEAQ